MAPPSRTATKVPPRRHQRADRTGSRDPAYLTSLLLPALRLSTRNKNSQTLTNVVGLRDNYVTSTESPQACSGRFRLTVLGPVLSVDITD